MVDQDFAPLLRQPDPIELAEALQGVLEDEAYSRSSQPSSLTVEPPESIQRPYAVLALLLDQHGRAAVISRTGGGWVLPGGKCEPNETPRNALIREIREETDIIVDGTHLVLGDDPFYVGPSYNGKLIWVFAGRLDGQGIDGQWVDEWDGPEGECRAMHLDDLIADCPRMFATTMDCIFTAWQSSKLG